MPQGHCINDTTTVTVAAAPGDPVTLLLGPTKATPEEVARIRALSLTDRVVYTCIGIDATNPCVTADSWVMTADGPRQVSELLGRRFAALVDGKPWDKTPPAPRVPREVIEKTADKYREALQRLTT